MMMALARKIVSGEDEDEAETVERSSPRRGTPRAPPRSCWWTTAGRRWKWSRRRSPSTATATTRLSLSAPRSSFSRPTANGPAPAPVNGNGNGHQDEAEEPQQSLFSWAEFMAEEPVKPKRRNGKPQPATISMFEWAMEQESEKETVGAGR